MREVLTEGLVRSGYTEQPTMYFARDGLGPEKWKSIMVDQDKQEAEVAIGLGGSSSCRTSEAITDVNWKHYSEAVEAGRIPLGSATRFSEEAQEARAVKMALSTLRPLDDELHQRRFPGCSLFDGAVAGQVPCPGGTRSRRRRRGRTADQPDPAGRGAGRGDHQLRVLTGRVRRHGCRPGQSRVAADVPGSRSPRTWC